MCAKHVAAIAALTLSSPAASETRSAATMAEIFRPYLASTEPGCAAAAAKGGRKVLDRAFGMADLEHGVPITPHTIFEAGSVSKQFTATAILLLAEEGKLSLRDDIRKYLPEIPNYGETITIDDLLHHTNGMRDWRFVRAVAGQAIGVHVTSNEDALDTARRQRALNHRPGQEYAYTNTGYNLAAVIVQRVSGKSLAAFSLDRIFRPLGMKATSWRDDFRRVVKGRATAYGLTATGFEWQMPIENAYGSGGLLTTTGDLLIWNQALEEGKLGERVSAQLQEQATLRNGEKTGYGRGLSIESYRGTTEVAHGGITLGYRAYLARFPAHNVSVAVLCNGPVVNPNELAHAIAERLLPSTLPANEVKTTVAKPVPALAGPPKTLWRPGAAELELLQGSYRSDEAGATYLAKLVGDRLVLELDGHPGERHILSPTYRHTFVFLGGTIRFETDAAGPPNIMILTTNRIRELEFTREVCPRSMAASGWSQVSREPR